MANKPINIIFGGDNMNNDFTQYIYELTLKFKDNSIKKFKEISNSKHCKIITFNKMIPFNNIDSYNLTITLVNFTNSVYSLNENFTYDGDSYIYKNDDIYIEFLQNNTMMTSCCCYVKALDNTRLFITPPNY